MLSHGVLAAFAVAVHGAGLVDNPIVADQLKYLDGEWTAVSSGGPSDDCEFTNDVDWRTKDQKDTGLSHAATSKEQCCGICLADSACTVAVYVPGSCWTKTAKDATESYSSPGRTSCKKKSYEVEGPDAGHTIKGKVPGDLLTDLQSAGLIGDPLFELNFKNSSIWNDYTWTYSTTFSVGAEEVMASSASSTMLVFDGVKMGAKVSVNGKEVGTVDDQFLRYQFALSNTDGESLLRVGANTISVAFDPAIDAGGRFMSCTGGWDWAPYTNTFNNGAHTFSKGIWKSVYLATTTTSGAAITHVVPQIFYQGDYPTIPLTDGTHAGFTVDVNVHLSAAAAGTKGQVCASGSWAADADDADAQAPACASVTLPAGDSVQTVTLNASASDVKLWWPAGHGAQPLYNLTVTFGGLRAQRQVGFRHFALVTGNDTDPEYVKKAVGQQGTDFNGMFFRINGAVVFSKGANMIPMEELEGRMNADAHRILVQSAVEGGMNTLRVWGGGMFLPDAWYDACDELGIMVYHDMQYAQQGHSPAKTDAQDAELRHQVRRLSHHTSIVLYDGCNECRVLMNTATAIYATFVMTVVAEEDKSRAIWPSCPAYGWSAGVDKLTVRPVGKGTGPGSLTTPLATPKGGNQIETHGPYQHGAGFPAVNGNQKLVLFNANIPIKVSETPTGPGLQNVFASEFGCVVMSSFESMSPTLEPKHWGLHAGMKGDDCQGGFASTCVGDNPMSDRNYPCDNIIDVYFGSAAGDFNKTGEVIFKKHLFQCMIGQALEMKADIETRRSKNEFGIIVWQYNEIWPTGGWGSIEYGTPVAGQVIGGRWKPLQYWYRASIYADVTATCGDGGKCYLKNDSPFPFAGSVEVKAVSFADGSSTTLKTQALDMPAGAGITQWFTITPPDGTTEVLVATVTDKSGAVMSKNVIPFATPQKMKLQPSNVKATIASDANADGTVDITVTAEHVAMYVTLTTLAQGRFSDNSFLLDSGKTTVQFIPFGGTVDLDSLKASLRIEDVSTYM